MADRTSARFFANIFKRLSDSPTPEHRAWARDLWRELFPADDNPTMMSRYGFRPYQMECQEALFVLDLARWNRDPKDDDLVYGPRKETVL